MKTLTLLLLLSATIFFSSCEKEGGDGTVTFYATAGGHMEVWVDSDYQGTITINSTTVPKCGGGISAKLSPGTHKWAATAYDGTIYSGTCTVVAGQCDWVKVR